MRASFRNSSCVDEERIDKNTGSSSETPNLNISNKRLRFSRDCSKLTVGWQPRHGASSGSRGALQAAKLASSEPNKTPAVSRIAFTRSAGAESGRVLVPRKDWATLHLAATADRVSHSSVPVRPCSCVQMSWARNWLPSVPENAKSAGYGSRTEQR